MVGKRKRFFAYLKKTHEEGGFWLNCVRLQRQVSRKDSNCRSIQADRCSKLEGPTNTELTYCNERREATVSVLAELYRVGWAAALVVHCSAPDANRKSHSRGLRPNLKYEGACISAAGVHGRSLHWAVALVAESSFSQHTHEYKNVFYFRVSNICTFGMNAHTRQLFLSRHTMGTGVSQLLLLCSTTPP